MQKLSIIGISVICFFATCAFAGPPYLNDDPQPTDYKKYEIYAFNNVSKSSDGANSEYGIDFNYGGFENTQLTAVLPWVNTKANGEKSQSGFGNPELAVKYKFLHQDKNGIDAAFFPRLYLPAKNEKFGVTHSQLLLPIFIQRDFGKYAIFGGGGCTLNNGFNSRNFCNLGATLTRNINSKLHIGAEIFGQTPDTTDAKASGGYGIGAIYDITNKYHFLISYNENRLNRASNYKNGYYFSILSTF